MYRVSKVEALACDRLHVQISDGVCGEIDLSERLFGSVFDPLKDPAVFSQVSVDEFGAVCWPNAADLAPEALYHHLAKVTQRKRARSY